MLSQGEEPLAESSPAARASELYGPEYYVTGFGGVPYERNSHWLGFFHGVADTICRTLRPKRVFDAGCAWGFLVEALRDRGVDAWGVDISSYAIGQVRPDVRPYCRAASLTEPIGGGPYDLVTCIEVLEHMPDAEARQAIRNMTTAADTVLFSSTPDDFNEPTHVNVRPIIDWLRAFAEAGFYPDVVFDAGFIAPHAFLVRRNGQPAPEDVLLLFSETLRYRSQRTALLAGQTLADSLQAECGEWKQRVEELSKEHEAKLAAVEGQRAAYQSLAKHCAALEMERDRSEAAAREWMARCTELSESLEAISCRHQSLQAELDASPGWRLINRYRRWLDLQRQRRPRLAGLWENGIRRALDRIE